MSPRSIRPAISFCLGFACLSGTSARAQVITFEDASAAIPFAHQSGAFGGDGVAGACWFDFDGDGNLDLFLTNGKTQPNALFKGDGSGGFTDVAVAAGVADGVGYCGVIAADIDNDGYQDIFLTGDGGVGGTGDTRVKLYRNRGDGTFQDITLSSGIGGQVTTLAAAFADIDGDGYLDLFICAPGSLTTVTQDRNKLYLNNGDRTFTDISASSGVDTDLGACACFFSDVNDDGWIDLIVADCNDVHFAPTPIELFLNNGDSTFTEVGAAAGLGAGGFWMGFGPADYDNDGDIDIFVTNLGGPGNRAELYSNDGDGTYTAVGASANADLLKFGWGAAFHDFDNDGWADIFYAGGLPGNFENNPGRLLYNNGDQTFTPIAAQLPVDMSGYASGVAAGDYDNDGFLDLVVAREPTPSHPNGQPHLLHNLGTTGGWVRIVLVGTVSNRDAVGARVRVTAGGLTQTKEIYAGSSFASMDSQWLLFGLGAQPGTDGIEVRWPGGLVETFSDASSGQTIQLVEGQGCEAGTNFCTSTPNSTGSPATIWASGSCFVSMADFELSAGPVAGEPGLFFYSPDVVNGGAGIPWGDGSLCIGPTSLFRLPLLAPGGAPVMTHSLDYGSLPSGGQVVAGSTWYFQAWFQDPASAGLPWNLSDGVGLTFRP